MSAKKKKMNKRGFIAYLAATNKITKEEAGRIYDMVINGIRNVMLQKDVDLSLMNFGRFYCQTHKGHPIQFESEKVAVPDYEVLKFSASNTMNKYLRGHLASVPPESDEDDEDEDDFDDEVDQPVNVLQGSPAQ